jgi:hypothetical protein
MQTTEKEILRAAWDGLKADGFGKKITGDVTISRDGTVNLYQGGDGSTFAKKYDEFILYEIGFMANETMSFFEAWDMIKDSIISDYGLRDFLGL